MSEGDQEPLYNLFAAVNAEILMASVSIYYEYYLVLFVAIIIDRDSGIFL